MCEVLKLLCMVFCVVGGSVVIVVIWGYLNRLNRNIGWVVVFLYVEFMIQLVSGIVKISVYSSQ